MDREAEGLFVVVALRRGNPGDVGGSVEGAAADQGLADHLELVPVEALLGFGERRRGGKLADRDRGDGFRLVRGSHRFLVLHLVEVVASSS